MTNKESTAPDAAAKEFVSPEAANETTKPNGTPSAEETAKIQTLEQKYISLLEQRIKDLEAKLDGPVFGPPTVTEAAAEDGGKKSEDQKDDKKPDRVRHVVSKWDQVTCQRKDRDAGETEEVDDKNKGRAFIFRKTQDFDNKFMYSEVEILSSDLIQLLKKELRHYPGHYWDGQTAIIMDPFMPLVHNWERLRTVAAEADKEELDLSEAAKLARSDLNLLLNIVESSSGSDKLMNYFKNREQMLANRTVTQESLWTLFSPGRLLIASPFFKMPQLFIAGVSFPFDYYGDDNKRRPWSCACWGYDWNGENFERTAFNFEIEQFSGSRTIDSLPIYPLDYCRDNQTELLEKLKARGKVFRKLVQAKKGHKMFSYYGKALYRGIGISTIDSATQVTQINDDDDRSYITASNDPINESVRRKLTKLMTCDLKHGPVMVDFQSFFQYADKVGRLGDLKPAGTEDNECGCPDCRENQALNDMMKFNFDKATRDSEFEDLQYQMCPPRVLGYVIERKMWAQLAVDTVQEAPRDRANATFDEKLKLDKKFKDLLRSLVMNHEAGKEVSEDGHKSKGIEDVVQGKGDGLVILLHGPPGVGKTLTAESVALRANKPLFSVGVTDVGVDPEKVQVNLERLFDLAGTWEAVLLIDEADVFLDSRAPKGGPTDLRRNAMVSVLLRVLEYYQGILILTTNRIRDFDIAVQSRIHLAIRYEDLDKEQQRDIFATFLDQAESRGLVSDRDDIDDWIKEDAVTSGTKLNGRQIRNIVSSALGLARQQNRKLERRHLEKVHKMTVEFKQETSVQEAVYRQSQIER